MLDTTTGEVVKTTLQHEQKLQKQTRFLRLRRSVFDLSCERKKKLLQQPASLEITPYSYIKCEVLLHISDYATCRELSAAD
jgi:hypothetical protein